MAEFSADPRGFPLATPSGLVEIASQAYAREYSRSTAEGTTVRQLHSELLRAEHLPFLKTLNIAHYDPMLQSCYWHPRTDNNGEV